MFCKSSTASSQHQQSPSISSLLVCDANQTPAGDLPSHFTLTRLSHTSCKIWEIRLVSHVNTLIKQLPNRVVHSDHCCIQSARCVNVLLILTHVYITHILTDDTDSFVSLSYAHWAKTTYHTSHNRDYPADSWYVGLVWDHRAWHQWLQSIRIHLHINEKSVDTHCKRLTLIIKEHLTIVTHLYYFIKLTAACQSVKLVLTLTSACSSRSLAAAGTHRAVTSSVVWAGHITFTVAVRAR